MSIRDYLLYSLLFAAILATQLGTRHPDGKRLLLPVVIVAAVGFKYLAGLPGGSAAWLLEGAGVAAGLVFGLAAVALMGVRRDPDDGRLVTVAGWPYAVVLILALALRLGFAFGSTHWFGRQVASFSVQHHVGPDTYAAAFVLMVLVMIAVRTAAVIIRGHAAGANIDWTSLPAARRLGA